MGTLARLGAAELRAVIIGYRDALRAHQDAINRLNVYPVPDGDTGTNMALTLGSVCDELESAPDDLAGTCKAISHGSLMGARGNSGVILSQILRGIVGVAADADGLDAASTATALSAASAAAYGAVMRPVEGTILTVVRECSEAATVAAKDSSAELVSVLEAAQAQGEEALARTPDLLPVLKEAGVVDAGGAGSSCCWTCCSTWSTGATCPADSRSRARCGPTPPSSTTVRRTARVASLTSATR